mgnify:CR=1 FL=1
MSVPIYQSSTFAFESAEQGAACFRGEPGFKYTRLGNPTTEALERSVALLEGGAGALGAASGMAAINSLYMTLLGAGAHLVATDALYGPSRTIIETEYSRFGVEADFVDSSDSAKVERAMRPETALVYVETPANPTLKLTDIEACAEIAHAHGAILAVDNTFASPYLQNPISLGADIVVHSMTKFIGGASDHIAGAICAEQSFIHEMMDLHTGSLMLLGPTMDPQVAYNLNLRIPHLPLRMTEHGERAMLFAQRLQDRGVNVNYPGLESHPDHELFRQLHCPDYGFGGILTLDLGNLETANRLMDMLQNDYRFGYMAVSLGYFDTLMSCSGSTTSSEMTEEDKRKAGISPGLVRMSLGITGTVEQRWRQLELSLVRLGVIDPAREKQAS